MLQMFSLLNRIKLRLIKQWNMLGRREKKKKRSGRKHFEFEYHQCWWLVCRAGMNPITAESRDRYCSLSSLTLSRSFASPFVIDILNLLTLSLFSVSSTGCWLYCPSRGGRVEKARAYKSGKARAQFHDGYSADKEGEWVECCFFFSCSSVSVEQLNPNHVARFDLSFQFVELFLCCAISINQNVCVVWNFSISPHCATPLTWWNLCSTRARHWNFQFFSPSDCDYQPRKHSPMCQVICNLIKFFSSRFPLSRLSSSFNTNPTMKTSWKMLPLMCCVKRGSSTSTQGSWREWIPEECELISGNSFWRFTREYHFGDSDERRVNMLWKPNWVERARESLGLDGWSVEKINSELGYIWCGRMS